MRIRTLGRLLTGIAIAALATVGLAAPAHAAHVVHLCSDTAVEGNPGQTLVVVNGCANPWYFRDWGSILQEDWNGSSSAQLDPGATRTFHFGAVGTGAIVDVYSRYPSLAITSHDPVIKTVSYPPFVGHDWLQQVDLPASGSCDDVPSTVGHWIGAPVGGWSLTWASWINDGRGGPVCTRELQDRPDATIILVG